MFASKKSDLIAKYISISILVIGGFFLLKVMFYHFKDEKEIYEFRAYTHGVILEYVKTGGFSYSVEYEYYVNDILYVNVEGLDKIYCNDNCIGAKYKVIYSKLNPQKSRLLATKKQFEIFDLEIPEIMVLE